VQATRPLWVGTRLSLFGKREQTSAPSNPYGKGGTIIEPRGEWGFPPRAVSNSRRLPRRRT